MRKEGPSGSGRRKSPRSWRYFVNECPDFDVLEEKIKVTAKNSIIKIRVGWKVGGQAQAPPPFRNCTYPLVSQTLLIKGQGHAILHYGISSYGIVFWHFLKLRSSLSASWLLPASSSVYTTRRALDWLTDWLTAADPWPATLVLSSLQRQRREENNRKFCGRILIEFKTCTLHTHSGFGPLSFTIITRKLCYRKDDRTMRAM